VTAFTAIAAVVLVASSKGGVQQHREAGLHYRAAEPGAHPFTMKVRCPPGTRVLGGGYATLEAHAGPDVVPTSLTPFDSGDPGALRDDGWVIRIQRTQESPVGTAVCRSGRPRYREASRSLDVRETGGLRAACPPGTHVVGGGVNADGNRINASYPFDSRDAGDAPDDGWQARVRNYSGSRSRLAVHAVCQSRRPTYRERTGRLSGDANGLGTFFKLRCSGGSRAISAGVKIGGKLAPGHTLRFLTTEDRGDEGEVPEDRIVAGAFSWAPPERHPRVEIFAICD
jgi:hypothetical protein